MRQLKIQIGQHFGRITAKEFAGSIGGHTSWHCVCDCGKLLTCRVSSLLSGKTKSCGCLKNDKTSTRATTHGLSDSWTYRKWIGMKSRCSGVSGKARENYVLRGIVVCERWGSFENFLADMGECPLGYELDRINNTGNYEPGNCQWVSRAQNQRNRRVSINVEHHGQTKPLQQWANELRIPYQVLRYRIQAGWPTAKAFQAKEAI